MVATYEAGSSEPVDAVRLLINDVDIGRPVFEDEEINVFLTLSGEYVLLAAALALDTIADNEVLTSKVLRTQDLQTDGAKAADSLRARAKTLRAQHEAEVEDDGYAEVIEAQHGGWPELTGGY